MRTWFRVVLPSGTYVVLATVGLAAATLTPPLIDYLFGLPVAFPFDSPVGLTLLILLAGIFGIFRVLGFHPVMSQEYRDWLKQTPWRWNLPLPAGPVHLVLQDVILIAIGTGFAYMFNHATPLMVPGTFLISYLIAMILTLWLTGQSKDSYLLAFGLGGLVYFSQSTIELSLLLAALYVAAWHGLQESLKRFGDWNVSSMEESPLFQFKRDRAQEVARSKLLGWPFDRLGPHRNKMPVSVAWSCAWAILAGWWCFVLLDALIHLAGNGPRLGSALMPGIAIYFGGGVATIRLWIYATGYSPPISLLGRLKTFRWIIPGYDVVLAVPLLIVLWGVAMIFLTRDLGWSILITAPAMVAGQLLMGLACPPSLDEWRLTGRHRIIPGTLQSAELQQTQ